MPNDFTQVPPESAAETPLSRRNFLMGAVICAGGLLLSRTPAQADILDTLNKFFLLDPIVLNYAFEMEELEKDFFQRALLSQGYQALDGREQGVFNLIAQQDAAHFAALNMERQRRGDKDRQRNRSESQRPRFFQYPGRVFSNRENLLRESIFLKENVLYAYHGAVDLVRDASLLGPAAAIAGVESRHVAVLREIAGLDPVPTSYEGQVSPQIIGERLGNRYGFKGGGQRMGGAQ